ncbi:MAG: cytochrome P460 family protein [Gammaproteobacteria bacterium]|nr:cytochrome P460 family protein [Gammaproteobacteria bacterium]
MKHLRQAITLIPYILGAMVLALAGLYFAIGVTSQSHADAHEMYKAKFNDAGELIRPAGWREWIFVGSPLTPNSLNPPEAAFPEFHSVYIDPESWAHYKETGTFREGTMFAKELTLVGETAATSGNGFFNGALQGFEIAHKDSSKYTDDSGGWAYYTFGHQAEPYADTAAAMPTAACAACHTAAAAEDMVFTQYYPILNAAKGAGDAGAGVGGKE